MKHHRPAARTETDNPFLPWLRKSLRESGKTKIGLARVLDIAPSEVTRMLDDKRTIKATDLAIIAAYVERPLPPIGIHSEHTPLVHSAKIVGEVHDGVWLDRRAVPEPAGEPMPYVPDQRFSGVQHFAVRIAGRAVDLYIPEGFYAFCVPYWQVRQKLEHDDFVFINLFRPGRHGELMTRAIRRVRVSGATVELHGASSNGSVEPIICDAHCQTDEASGDRIEIVGLVVWRGAPMPDRK